MTDWPPGTGITHARVWDLDSGELSRPRWLQPPGASLPCVACGAQEAAVLIVEGQHGSLAFCDNGHCSIRVAAIAEFTPDLSYPGPAGMEFAGAVRCACGTARAVAGPAGNWSLGYCACGRGVLGRPRPEALAPAAVAS